MGDRQAEAAAEGLDVLQRLAGVGIGGEESDPLRSELLRQRRERRGILLREGATGAEEGDDRGATAGQVREVFGLAMQVGQLKVGQRRLLSRRNATEAGT